jgi:hypothetical protein
VLLSFPACIPAEENRLPDETFLPPTALVRGIGTVFAPGFDKPIAVGAIVRVTWDTAVVLAAPPPGTAGPFRVKTAGEAPVEATVLANAEGFLVLAMPRAGRDLRPFEAASEAPAALARVSLLVPEAVSFGGARPCVVSAEPPEGRVRSLGVAWLAAAPKSGDQDEQSALERARRATGGIVFDRQGRLVGLVAPPDDELPRILVAATLPDAILEAILKPPGADLLRPDDGFLVATLRVESVTDLPRCEEDQGSGPMLVLEVRVAGELAGRVEVTPGRRQAEATIVARAKGPVAVSLVALDRSLAKGETRVELVKPATVPELAPVLELDLELKPEALDRFPMAAKGPRSTRVRLAFESVDPDRAAGPYRTPLGATPISLGRPAEAMLCLASGQADEFFSISTQRTEDVALIVLRRTLGTRIELRAFSPNYEGDVLAIALDEQGPRVAIATGRLPRGRTLLRARESSGSDTHYEALVAPRGDAAALVAPLFRLVNREASRDGTAFLDSDPLIEEIAAALEKAEIPRDALARAVIDELGSRVLVARRLAFLLLERHFIPSADVLREAWLAGGAAGDDAGLILAELEPRDARLRATLRRAAVDLDPYVRARALRVAARSGDPGFAEELARMLEKDTAPIVERAVAAVRLEAASQKPGEDGPR